MRRAGEGGDGKHTRHCSEHNRWCSPLLERPWWGQGWETAVIKEAPTPG